MGSRPKLMSEGAMKQICASSEAHQRLLDEAGREGASSTWDWKTRTVITKLVCIVKLLHVVNVLSQCDSLLRSSSPTPYPPVQNQYMQEKKLGELIFARINAGPVFALARMQENILEESFSA